MTLGYFWMIRHLFRSDVCQGACRSRSQIRPLLSLLEAVTSNVSSGEKSTDLNKSRVNILFIDMDWPKKTHCRPLEDSLSHFTQSLISIETITGFEEILIQMIFIQMQPSSTKEPVCPWRVAWRHRCLSLIKLWHHLRLQNCIPKHQTNCLKKVFGFPALGTKLSLNRNVQTSSNIMPPFFIHLHPIKFSKKSRGCCGYPHLASALNRPKLCRSVQRGGSHLESVETEA